MAVSSPPSNRETFTLTATCHCNFFHATYSLPCSSLPLKSSICHCTTCRKTSGHLFATFAVIPSPQRPEASALTAYAASDHLTRYFCPRCGASVANFEADEWEFATGMLDRTGDGLLDRVQMWLEDTKDGGAGLWLNDARSERHVRDRIFGKLAFQDVAKMAEESRSESMSASTTGHHENDPLHASCRCGAVSFEVARPDADSNGSALKKYPAGLDVCKSCRTVTGFEITSWAIVPRDRIRKSINKAGSVSTSNVNTENYHPLDLLNMSALSYYKTSGPVTRGFCSTCGANVFYYRHRGGTGKEDTIDIAAGILESRAGVRAEDWLAWDYYGEDVVAYREDALDRRFVEGLVRGIKEDTRS